MAAATAPNATPPRGLVFVDGVLTRPLRASAGDSVTPSEPPEYLSSVNCFGFLQGRTGRGPPALLRQGDAGRGPDLKRYMAVA